MVTESEKTAAIAIGALVKFLESEGVLSEEAGLRFTTDLLPKAMISARMIGEILEP